MNPKNFLEIGQNSSPVNNIFQFATKELSQDAVLCWSLNFLNFPNHPLFQLGKDLLNCLSEGNIPGNGEFEIRRQYKNIDILVLRLGENKKVTHTLIIEDKTESFEHGNQVERYKQIVENDFIESIHYSSYVKTGIIYDKDRDVKTDTIVNIDDLIMVFTPYAIKYESEIIKYFIEYLGAKKKERAVIEDMVRARNYYDAFNTEYGQLYFMETIFDNRERKCIDDCLDGPQVYDNIYSGINKSGGSFWTQYCFWGDTYRGSKVPHWLFWRIDMAHKKGEAYPYIALRHYDNYVDKNDKNNPHNFVKRFFYKNIRNGIDQYIKEDSSIDAGVFSDISGNPENLKESNVIFILFKNIEDKDFSELEIMLKRITAKAIEIADTVSRTMPVSTD